MAYETPRFALDLPVRVSADLHAQARAFLDFLRRAGKKHSLSISISSKGSGRFRYAVAWKDSAALDLFLQELMFNQALYYYLCGFSARRELARLVVKPIFEALLESRFRIVYPSLVRRHLLDGSFGEMMAGDFLDGAAQEYQILFQQLKLKMISGYEFIRNLDDLLTEFMLFQLDHKKGEASPNFDRLVDGCGRANILRDREVRKRFKRVHALRTRGLHRLEREIPEADLSQLAMQFYFFFEYLEDYFEAQDRKTVKCKGKLYRRIRYGKEPVYKGMEQTWEEIITRPCHDCGVIRGELHLEGCDVERCPCCLNQFLGCLCIDYDDR